MAEVGEVRKDNRQQRGLAYVFTPRPLVFSMILIDISLILPIHVVRAAIVRLGSA